MANKKVSDSALREAIKANPTGTYTAIAKAVGLATGGYTYRRIDKIRAELNGVKSTEPALAFSDIKENDRLLRSGKRLVVVTTDPSYIRVRRMDGSTETISRKDFSEHAAEYTRVPTGDPQGGPVTTYYIEPGTEPGKDAPTELTREERTEMEGILEGLKEEIEPKKPLFEPVDYIDPEWGVTEPEEPMDEITIPIKLVAGNRPYLDRISHLLDIMAPECRKTPLLKMDVMTIAISMLNRGFDEEVRNEQDQGNRSVERTHQAR
jgi:hypothetical protein